MRYPETAALIKSARKRKGLSQEKAAIRVGCTRLQWINWESGKHRPTKFVGDIADVLSIERDQLEQADDDEESDLAVELAKIVRELVRSELRQAVGV